MKKFNIKKKKRRKSKAEVSEEKQRLSMRRYFNTTSKVMVWFVVLNAEIQIYLCYRLAFLGQMTALESLGQTIVLEIVAPVMLLILKAVIENVFEKNIIFPHKDSAAANPVEKTEENEAADEVAPI